MKTDVELARLTPEELLVMIMQSAGKLIESAGNCHRFGWELKFGTGTNNELLLQEKKNLDQLSKAFFLQTRGVS